MSDLTDVKTIYNGVAGVKTVAVSGTPNATSATDVKTVVNGEAAIKVYNLNGGGGSGAVDSVNGKTGIVVLDGEDISAEVGGEVDTIQGHLQTISDGLGDLDTSLNAHAADGTVHVTAEEKAGWNAKITNPDGGTAGQVLTKTEDGEEWADAQGGSSLPDPTGHEGEFLTNDGTDASWADVNAMEIIDWEA